MMFQWRDVLVCIAHRTVRRLWRSFCELEVEVTSVGLNSRMRRRDLSGNDPDSTHKSFCPINSHYGLHFFSKRTIRSIFGSYLEYCDNYNNLAVCEVSISHIPINFILSSSMINLLVCCTTVSTL